MTVTFSIEIPAVHGTYLETVFRSIESQTYQDYEVIVVNSGGEKVSELIRRHGFREIKRCVRLLKARFLAHASAAGNKAILLDETRCLRRDALEIIARHDADMVILGEREVGNSFWSKLAQLDKENIMLYNPPDPRAGFALPRVFSSKLLSSVFDTLRNKLKNKFDEVIAADHSLIYYQAYEMSRKFSIIKDELVFHYGDRSISGIIRKYYRYGKSIKAIKGTEFEVLTQIARKRRHIHKGNVLALYLLYAVRGIPFFLGSL